MSRTWPRLSVEPHAVVMAVVFLGALVTGYALLPGVNERIAMLERDGHNVQALSILEQRFAAGDRRPRTLYQLVGLYEQFGNLPRLKETLEALAEARPRDPQVRRQLVQFYAATQDNDAYLSALEGEIEVRYSETACREIVGLQRMRGEYAREQSAIVRCRQKGYRRAEDIVRLAELVAADGDYTQASQLLRSVDDLKRLKSDRERLQLFTMLIDADQPREALRRAVRWAKAARDKDFSLTLIETLVRRGKHDVAIELAREISTPGDAIALTAGEIMLDRGETVAARSFLRGWMQSARDNELDTVVRFVDSALDAEDTEAAYDFAMRTGLSRLPQSQLVALAEALSVVGRRSDFDSVRAALTADTLAANPLLGAAEQLDKGEADASRRLLARVEPDKLDAWRLTLWARLMRETGRGAEAETTLRTLGVDQEGAGAAAIAVAARPGALASGRRVAEATPIAARPASEPATRVLRRKKKAKRLQARTAARAVAKQAELASDKKGAAKAGGGGAGLPWPFSK